MSPASRTTRREEQRRALDRMMAHRPFRRMITRQGIDLSGGWWRGQALEDIVFQALRRCASCAAAAECRCWLDGDGPRARYVTFCPNTPVIETCRILDPTAPALTPAASAESIFDEPDLAAILDDPITELVMASDHCAADQLRDLLRAVAEHQQADTRIEEETMPKALDALRQDHGNTAALLRSLEWQISEFASCNRPDYDVIAATLDYFLSFPELEHHPKEELIYARLRQRDPAIAQHIGDLTGAHRELAARVREFAAALRAVLGEAEVSREAFVGWARGFIDLQWQHITLEEESFFPAAERALTAQDWVELSGKLTTRDDPLFGQRVDERFERLRETILHWQAQDQATAEPSRINPALLP